MSDSQYRWIDVGGGRQRLVKVGEEGSSRRRKAPGAGWPLECDASGVHPEQAGELRQYLADRGCPTEISRNGNPIYRDASHRRQALKLRGLHDRNSFS